MKHIGIVKTETLINILNWLGIPLICVYFACMLIAPWIVGNGDWSYVQSVWHNWQSLNVGILAFTSSIIALNISRFNANKQRERDFIAARAFLPEALSELMMYFSSSAKLLTEALKRVNDESDRCKTPLQTELPNLPICYKETFSHCIAYAEPDVGEYLAYMLVQLQIHHSRLKELNNSFSEDSISILTPENIICYLYCLAELQALSNKLFGFARAMEEFKGRSLSWDDFNTAYSNFGLWVEDFDGLAEFTQRAIARNSSS